MTWYSKRRHVMLHQNTRVGFAIRSHDLVCFSSFEPCKHYLKYCRYSEFIGCKRFQFNRKTMHAQKFIEDLSHKRSFCLNLWNPSNFFAHDFKDLQVPALLFIHCVPFPTWSNNPEAIWMDNMLSGDKRSRDCIGAGNKTHMLFLFFFRFQASRIFILNYATSSILIALCY